MFYRDLNEHQSMILENMLLRHHQMLMQMPAKSVRIKSFFSSITLASVMSLVVMISMKLVTVSCRVLLGSVESDQLSVHQCEESLCSRLVTIRF